MQPIQSPKDQRRKYTGFSQDVSAILTPEQILAIRDVLLNSPLTEEQIIAITQALVTAQTVQQWHNSHPVNLRLTSPIPGLKFYLVLLAGRERRSTQRLKVERQKHPVLTPLNILVMAITLGSFAISLTTFTYVMLKFVSPSGVIAPVSIPWLDEKRECEKTERIWQNGECWDSEHSPEF
ncbi:MAG: hypothetical protein SWJ54_06425 [Cyanobacteriota bacterium]|nr:hypothetical protein [Cyanobacteriota bacterium]